MEYIGDKGQYYDAGLEEADLIECPMCDGSGEVYIVCKRCHGTGWIGGRSGGEICCGGWDSMTCPRCGGDGEIDIEEA